MIRPVDAIKIAPEVYKTELLPALVKWHELVKQEGVSPHLWFLFGSVVIQTADEQSSPQDPMQLLVNALLGIREPSSHSFRNESDIDVGLVVSPDEDEIDLRLYEESSPFRTTTAGGHVLSLTRFTTDWVSRRGTSVPELRASQNPTLGIYGQIVLIDV